MTRKLAVMLLLIVPAAGCFAPLAGAAAKYRPCSLLSPTELEMTLGGKVDQSNEADVTIPDGPFKGEIMSTCNWTVGSRFVTLNVIRGPRNSQEQAAGVASLRATQDKLKQQGWTVEPANLPGADCVSTKPPASEPSALPGSSCAMVSKTKGLALWLGVNGPVTVQQVKVLADKVASRL